MSDASDIGLIVGSGFAWLALDVREQVTVPTPYGTPSGPVSTVVCGGTRVRCIARHGVPPALAPHEVNYRANVWALHSVGVRRLLAINVVGSIAADFPPGALAVPEQLIDYTSGRASTFGGAGAPVVHVEFAEPFDAALGAALGAAIAIDGSPVRGGVYGVTQGPRLETAAEIERLARDGCTMVGMTAMPEASLARELDLRYALCALAVNWAAGRGPTGGAGIHAEIERHLASGMRRVGAVLERSIPAIHADAL